MLKSLVFLVLIHSSITFLQWYFYVYPMEIKKGEDIAKPVENHEVERLSENEGDKNLNLELKKFYEHKTLCEKNIMKYDNLIKTIDNYVQRYVNLFLTTSNLHDHEVKDMTEIINIDLEISLTGEDLIYLQGYSKSSPVYPKNFSKLDAIFYKIAKRREKTLLERAMRQSHSFFEGYNIFSVFKNPIFTYFFPLLVTLLVTWLIYEFRSQTFSVFFVMVLNSFLLWESLNFYWKKLKEAEAEIYVKMLELRNAPEKCNPANIGWFDTFRNLFKSESECLQYYKNLDKKAVEEVSILKCIIDTYSYYIIQTPFRIIGSCIRHLTVEISDIWPGTVKYLISFPFAMFSLVVILFFIFALFMRRIRVSLFGLSVEVGGGQSVPGLEKRAVTGTETPRTNRIIRKLRPWTKSRYPRRLDMDLGKRRKLKYSRSQSEISVDSEPDVNNTTEDLNNSSTTDK